MRRPVPRRPSSPQAYQAALDGGADSVVSVHLSAALSGTWESAVLAAQDFGYGVVRVVDSRSTGAGLGFAVLAGRGVRRRRGRSGRGAGCRGPDRRRHADVLLCRHARVPAPGWAGWIGRRVARDVAVGEAAAAHARRADRPAGKGSDVGQGDRAVGRADRLRGGNGPVDLAVQHLAATERADAVAAQLRAALPGLRNLYIAELGPVVGAHLGPGGLGTAIVRVEPA